MEHRGRFAYSVEKGCIGMTNAQKIRAMSDEELTKMLWKAGRNYRSICADPVVDYNEHYEHLIEWLQQPAEEEDKHEAD